MRTIKLIAILVLISSSLFAQDYVRLDGSSTMTGGLKINRSNYLGNWLEMSSTYYSPNQYWKWWIESDGLKLSRSNDGSNYTTFFQVDDLNSILQLYADKIRLNGNVGIGTLNPNGKLEVRGSINYSLNDQVKTILHTNGDGNSYFNYIGGATNSRIGFQIDGSSKMSIMNNGDVGIGKIPSAKLDVAGNIKAQEIEVALASMHDLQLNGTLQANNITYTTNGQTADHVFSDTYQLRDLAEVEAFITTNKHLPDVPSAAQMEADGVNLAEMNKLLLQKVEELTLYAIERKAEAEKNKAEVERLKEEGNNQQGKMKLLEERLIQIEKLIAQ